MDNEKLFYVSPVVEILEFEAEQVFASSGEGVEDNPF